MCKEDIAKMLVNCPNCSARVNADSVASIDEVEREDGMTVHGTETLISLLRCPSCYSAIISKQHVIDFTEGGYGENLPVWGAPKRVWPNPEAASGGAIPASVAVSLNEASGCLSSGFYTSSVVMSGRALEAVARHFQIKETGNDRPMLGRGLKELHDTGKIDQRLFEWGEELRQHRNLAAHATDHIFEQQDAKDLFEFANAICEYLFVLQDRYDRFVKRKAQRKEKADPLA